MLHRTAALRGGFSARCTAASALAGSPRVASCEVYCTARGDTWAECKEDARRFYARFPKGTPRWIEAPPK